MKTVEVIVEHAGKNLSAYIEGAPVITVGNDMREIEENIKEAIELYLEDNSNPCELLSGEFELKFKIDAATFINYYSSIFTKAALSRNTGINERQLWHLQQEFINLVNNSWRRFKKEFNLCQKNCQLSIFCKIAILRDLDRLIKKVFFV